MTDPKPRTSRQIVLQSILDLAEHSQPASRQRLLEITGLTYGAVDVALKDLRTEGLIRCVANGYYEPIDQDIDRSVSTTSLPHGRLKVEIGDDVIADLTPREALALAKQLAGLLFAFGAFSWALMPPAQGGRQG
ncbi:hypothetical protein [Hydrogenophaga atypica]|uniref:Uncharacterized protein n=1 Tax=Hydrogenophaga atypica TaxID=249409 RepID=A0ABW2QQA7_9BURK